MQEELSLYVEPVEVKNEPDAVETQLYSLLSGFRSSSDQIDRPADRRLIRDIMRAKKEDGSQSSAQDETKPTILSAKRKVSYIRSKVGFTITDFLLLIIACLLFLNIITE